MLRPSRKRDCASWPFLNWNRASCVPLFSLKIGNKVQNALKLVDAIGTAVVGVALYIGQEALATSLSLGPAYGASSGL